MKSNEYFIGERLRIVSAATAASWVVGDRAIATLTPDERRSVFKEVARNIVKTDRERRKYRLSTDTGGAIYRAMEWAFRAGVAFSKLDRSDDK